LKNNSKLQRGPARDDRIPVLALDEEIPFPCNTGKRIRTYNILKQLARYFAIDLLVHKNNADAEAMAAMREIGVEPVVASSSIPAKSGPRFWWTLVGHLFGPYPYSVASHYQAGYRQRLEELLSTRNYDLVHCEWTPYGRYLRQCPLPWMIATHNVEFQILERFTDNMTGIHKLFYSLQARRMRRFEVAMFRLAHGLTAVSEGDAAFIERLSGRRPTVVANGVDLEYFSPASGQADSHQMVFTGSMDWRPNQDGLRWFLERIVPLLPADSPWSCKLVGRNPPEWLSRMCGPEGFIDMIGTVPDVRPYVHRAGIYIVPLRIGGGSRLKILEALAMGKAIVSTTIGAEGLGLEDGRHLLLADSPEDFAAAIVRLAGDADLQASLGSAGRSFVERHYSWDRIALHQKALWERLATSGREG